MSSFNAFSLNLIELGQLAAYLALTTALIQALAPLAARLTGRPALAAISVNAAPVLFGLTTVGGITLIHAFLHDNFSVQYVATNSNSMLPTFYKVTALWGGHEGSLYLWTWVLTAFTLVISLHGRRHYPERLPVILAVQGWLTVGFFGLILFLSNPFLRLFPMPGDGRDLNPLLQDPGMVIHPPMLYLGYVGFSVPFAFAIAALVTRWKSELWIGWVRRWALIAWAFLTTGILLGAWWAYYELGWGGYWAWDPVENASLMPWLMGTALIHSITVQERRRMLHTWNLFLVISTFALSLLGTFLVRSGVLSSVHAFAVDPGRGLYILGFMTTVLVVSYGLFLARGGYQEAEESMSSLASRESLFVWNNVLFTTATVVVLLGTLYPLALDAFAGAKITVGAPYFNSVMVPLFLVVLLLMAVAPLVPWRKADLARLASRLRWPALAGALTGTVTAVIAWPTAWVGPVAIGLLAMVLATLGIDLARAVVQRRLQHAGEGAGRALVRTVLGNRRHYGGMIVHLGIIMIGVGLVGAGLFKQDKSVSMLPGETVEIAGESLRFDGVREQQGPNYMSLQGRFTVLGSGAVVYPERRNYPVQQMPTTESGIDSTWLRDLYVVIGEISADQRWAVHTYAFPLIRFMWTGGLVVLIGVGLSLSFRVRRRAAAVAAAAAQAG